MWPSSTIPYEISSKIGDERRRDIKSGMVILENKTCLKFKQRTCCEKKMFSFLFGMKPMPKDYIFFQDDEPGCYSKLGRQGGKQIINLNGCDDVFSIIHEILHALGFLHEHQRMDRDKYIEVRYNNLKEGLENEFVKKDSDTMGITYDFYSVMHYGSFSGSKDDNKPVLVPKVAGVGLLIKNNTLSDSDVLKINKLFKC
ncbi:zinc metalloproteinase nas-4-like isoform X3 [Planococcus citri]